MIDFFKLERVYVDNTNFNQVESLYCEEYRGKLVVDKYAITYFSPDGVMASTVVSSVLRYDASSETYLFDHRDFLKQIDATQIPDTKRSASVTPLDVELLIKLKQEGGFTVQDLVALREAGIV